MGLACGTPTQLMTTKIVKSVVVVTVRYPSRMYAALDLFVEIYPENLSMCFAYETPMSFLRQLSIATVLGTVSGMQHELINTNGIYVILESPNCQIF